MSLLPAPLHCDPTPLCLQRRHRSQRRYRRWWRLRPLRQQIRLWFKKCLNRNVRRSSVQTGHAAARNRKPCEGDAHVPKYSIFRVLEYPLGALLFYFRFIYSQPHHLLHLHLASLTILTMSTQTPHSAPPLPVTPPLPVLRPTLALLPIWGKQRSDVTFLIYVKIVPLPCISLCTILRTSLSSRTYCSERNVGSARNQMSERPSMCARARAHSLHTTTNSTSTAHGIGRILYTYP